MTATRKSGFVLPVAVTLAVLLGLYVGGYCFIVEPVTYDIGNPFSEPPEMVTVPLYGDYAHQPRSSERWATFFAPIHWLDRRIRPDVWEPMP